ncbi:HutD family protein [Pseudolysobacter antarcticus]|uniref:HutD family protein n=1 Tax=Pseudolysobacter antarcticus TaxID=2511995 RepID=A0A411HPY7_9GAMM|nr:HutD family protein [Pseudolysobacter antarcticus]
MLTTADYRRMRWKNGLGWTTEIAVSPADAIADYDWRVSIAEIENDCAFSAFPGFDRTLLVLHGAGIELTFDQAPSVILHERDRPAQFAGEWQATCRLLNGPTRDFNVMTRRGIVSAELLHRPLVGAMWFHASAHSEWLIHMLAGSAKVAGLTKPLETGDSLWLSPHSGHRLLDGGGDLLVVKFTRITANAATDISSRGLSLHPHSRPSDSPEK